VNNARRRGRRAGDKAPTTLADVDVLDGGGLLASLRVLDLSSDDGDAVGVNSTPTFLINGIEMAGLPSDRTFDYVINSELKQRASK